MLLFLRCFLKVCTRVIPGVRAPLLAAKIVSLYARKKKILMTHMGVFL